MASSLFRERLLILLSDGTAGDRHSLFFEVGISSSRVLENRDSALICLLCRGGVYSDPSPADTRSGDVTKRGGVQTLNLGIIQRASIQINTFPSAHAAASMAVALAITQVDLLIGGILIWLALSIAAAAAVCRYHFTADVVIGTLIAIVWYVLLQVFS